MSTLHQQLPELQQTTVKTKTETASTTTEKVDVGQEKTVSSSMSSLLNANGDRDVTTEDVGSAITL